MSIGYPKRLPSKGGVFIIKTIFIKILCTEKKRPAKCESLFLICVGTALSFQAVARQVFSTLMSLTSVFGMGTGGSSSPLAPTIYLQGCKLLLEVCPLELCSNVFVPSKSNNENVLCKGPSNTWSSPRPISTAKLNASRHLHLQPINLVVFKGSYLVNPVGYLISGAASCLDAFSVYPFRT